MQVHRMVIIPDCDPLTPGMYSSPAQRACSIAGISVRRNDAACCNGSTRLFSTANPVLPQSLRSGQHTGPNVKKYNYSTIIASRYSPRMPLPHKCDDTTTAKKLKADKAVQRLRLIPLNA
jgi:hypothetical protein